MIEGLLTSSSSGNAKREKQTYNEEEKQLQNVEG